MGLFGMFKKDERERPHVLVVDDSSDIVNMVSGVLRAIGYAVITAPDGAQAMKLAVAERPRLILLDVNMPVVDGRQTLALLKGDPNTRDIPVIMATAEQLGKDVEDAFALGAVDYIVKPIRIPLLVEKVRQRVPPPERGVAPK